MPTLLFIKRTLSSSASLLSLHLSFITKIMWPPPSPPLHSIAQLWSKVLRMPAFIAHSNIFPVRFRNASSVTMPASPARCPVCASPLLLYTQSFIHLSTLCDLMCSPHLEWWSIFVRKKEYGINKGNAAQRGMIFGTLLMWFSMYHRDLFSFYYPFWMCMIVCLWELCVTLYARGSSLVVLLYVCVCVIRETTLNLLIW